jgi:hypothetical protein
MSFTGKIPKIVSDFVLSEHSQNAKWWFYVLYWQHGVPHLQNAKCKWWFYVLYWQNTQNSFRFFFVRTFTKCKMVSCTCKTQNVVLCRLLAKYPKEFLCYSNVPVSHSQIAKWWFYVLYDFTDNYS